MKKCPKCGKNPCVCSMTEGSEHIDEKLTKDMSAGDVISDFVHSKDPRFKGKSKKERQHMALGAFYKMQREEKEDDDTAWYAAKEMQGKEYADKKYPRKPKKAVKEEVEGDYEFEMARNELATAERAIERIMQIVGQGEGNLEAWVQSKITKGSDYLDTVADYLESQQKNGD